MNISKSLLLCSFLSGASALIYQLLWFNEINLVFGVAYLSLATLLSAFLIGLLIGNLYGGKFVQKLDSLKKVAKIYIFIELLIALFAFLVPILIKLSVPLLSHYYNSNLLTYYLLRLIIFVFILIIPCSLIGSTFPFLFRLYSQDRSSLKMDISKLYFFNTAGAFFGVIICGFILIRFLGINLSLITGMLLNILVSFIIFKQKFADGVFNIKEVSSDKIPKSMLLLFFSTGFISFGLEILWTRMLSIYYFSTIYATTLIIATILIGFAVGSLFFKKYYSNYDLKYFAFIQVIASIFIISGFLFYSNFPEYFARGFGANVFLIFFACFILAFFPSFCFGLSFPLLMTHTLTHISNIESSLGKIYSYNLLGSIFGALITGFFFIPVLGFKLSLMIFVILLIFLSIISRVFTHSKSILFFILFISLLFILFNSSNLNFYHSNNNESNVLYYADGQSASVSLTSQFDGYRNITRIYVDGQPVASDSSISLLDSRVLAHIPLLLHSNPKSVLTVGFGSGGTSNAMLLHDLEEVDVVEIEPKVVETYNYFKEINGDILKDSRLNVIFDDARSYLALTNKTYDVISTDVTNLRYASNSNLYTTDYFKIIKSRLNKNGFVSVWVPVLDINIEGQKILLASFAEVFPQVSVWYPYHKLSNYYVFIGSEQTLSIDYERIKTLFNMPSLKKDFDLVDITPENFVLSLFLDDLAVRSYIQGSKVHSDNNPILAFPDLMPGEDSFTPSKNFVEIFSNKIDSSKYLVFEEDFDKSKFIKSLNYEKTNFLEPILIAHIAYLNQDYSLAGQIYSQLFPKSEDLLDALP